MVFKLDEPKNNITFSLLKENNAYFINITLGFYYYIKLLFKFMFFLTTKKRSPQNLSI
jgi:hypothetical protein